MEQQIDNGNKISAKVMAIPKLPTIQPAKIVNYKSQLISKGLFSFFNSPKKRTKNYCPSRLGQKLTFSSSFLGELKTLKFPFEIN